MNNIKKQTVLDNLCFKNNILYLQTKQWIMAKKFIEMSVKDAKRASGDIYLLGFMVAKVVSNEKN
jgi:hypothetical protein